MGTDSHIFIKVHILRFKPLCTLEGLIEWINDQANKKLIDGLTSKYNSVYSDGGYVLDDWMGIGNMYAEKYLSSDNIIRVGTAVRGVDDLCKYFLTEMVLKYFGPENILFIKLNLSYKTNCFL